MASSEQQFVHADDATGDDLSSIPPPTCAAAGPGGDATAVDDESLERLIIRCGALQLQQPRRDAPLLAFNRFKGDMHTLSLVSSSSDDDRRLVLRKNVDDEHYGLLRKPENLYFSTPQGWMLILEYPPHVEGEPDTSSSTAAYLWNPRTGGKLPLPNIHEYHDTVLMSKCRLTHKDPSHPGCVVVLLLLLFKDEGIIPHMWFCRISGGTPAWRCLPYEIPSLGVPTRRFITVITAFQGKLYFINSSASMGVIHFPSSSGDDDDDPVFQYFDVPRISDLPHGTTSGNNWLVTSPDNQHLFLIYQRYQWNSRSKTDLLLAVHAYKMDFLAPAWRRVRDIGGDAVVFLDGGYSRIAASCAASPLGLKPNQIYFLDYRKDDGNGASSYHLCTFDLGLDILEDIWVIPQSLLLRGTEPFWIVPPTT